VGGKPGERKQFGVKFGQVLSHDHCEASVARHFLATERKGCRPCKIRNKRAVDRKEGRAVQRDVGVREQNQKHGAGRPLTGRMNPAEPFEPGTKEERMVLGTHGLHGHGLGL
jgi:hypothetical protein